LFFDSSGGCSPEAQAHDILKATQKIEGFKPGGIHNCFEYWAEVLKAGDWVLDIIKNGYKVPFHSHPPMEELPNNATVKANPKVTEELIKEYLNQGVLRKVDGVPHCVNPLGLVTKLVDGKEKYRLIFDGSRCVKKYFEKIAIYIYIYINIFVFVSKYLGWLMIMLTPRQ